ncbi:6-phosphogluconolactonase [Pilibacter termitis]|uniref:6-phosphogluconolactonase n=1 Tax=Pilibacter termitis TaxID=263852 RepID=A0A1T4K3C4_9ENTE|nr:lactonase family protein [Pilibacter termitis]SJZ36926.1 6-phosphogluconolactonase [Pilibacter termitis]
MTEKILFGGYTKRVSEGMYSLDLNKETKQLENLTLIAKEPNPTYLVVDKSQHLYSVGAVEELGGVAAFSFENNQATLLNHVVSTGAPLCYVGVDEVRNLVYGANYHLGEVRVYKRLANGSLELADTAKHTGSGPHKNQTSPHVHYTDLTPDNRLVACDLGTDGVYLYDVSEEGKLSLVSTYQANAGAGSRHITFHPNGRIAYLFGELNSTIEVLAYDKEKAEFSLLQVISTLPEDFSGESAGAAVRLSADGKYLYASNRGHNSIVVYKVSENGEELTTIQWASTHGDFPRDFNFSQDEDFLIVANQDSDNVTLFARNKENGELVVVQKNVFLPEGTCVLSIGE